MSLGGIPRADFACYGRPMSNALLRDAFAHNVWATLRILHACLALNPEQLKTAVPGTYGSILDTARHLVGADYGYLFVLTGERMPMLDEEQMTLEELRALMETNGSAWAELVAEDLEPDADVLRHLDEGNVSHAPVSIRLAQALHHGTDHRSQICTVLTTLGVEPPGIDVWDFGREDGRVHLIPA